jgi:hypothetical protein
LCSVHNFANSCNPAILREIQFIYDIQFTSNVINITRDSHSQLPHQVVQSTDISCKSMMWNTTELSILTTFNWHV